MSKHTPGPWRLITRDGDNSPCVQRGREGGFAVQGLSPEREDADASLISAAPELLEALIEARNDLRSLLKGMSYDARIDSAIAKATGESE